MSSRCRSLGIVALAVLAAIGVPIAGAATSPESSGALRVCADPNNLPFSNARGEGFENRIAELLARELGVAVRYTWWAQRRGFVRNTLGAGACDVVIGVPAGWGPVLATRPYYRSTYVFAWRRADGPAVRSLDDPRLRAVRIGVQLVGADGANTPPAHALARRGIVDNVRGFTVYGDYAEAAPAGRILDALAAGAIDVAVAWGPLAGWLAARSPVAIDVAPVTPALDGPALPFSFAIAAGVRRGDTALRDRLDTALTARRVEIDAILDAYRVPRVETAP